jgi:type II secretory pathway predicted ATPase ExeA/CheY-like chemotaxis protein
MYEKFYGLRGKPFSLLPDPEFLYLSDKHRMALTLLEYGLWNQASFSVITGEIGAGKTTLIRHLLNQFDSDLVVGLISNTHPSFGELLEWILLAFNIDYSGKDKVGMYKAFVDFLIREYASNRRTLLIIDEAQNMSHQALEELRMLSNVNAEKDQVLQVILVGQPGLREHLRDPSLEQFAQRIAVDYHLGTLGSEETRNYIRHRVEVAGGDPDLFTDEACEAIFQHSGGTPRLINILCDTTLVYGYAEQSVRIDARLVNDVARDKQSGSILPLRQVQAGGQGDDNGGGNKATSLRKGKKKLRILVASDSESQRSYLKMVLERSGMQVVSAVPLSEQLLDTVDQESVDVVLVDLDEHIERESGYLDNLLDHLREQCRLPVLFNDSSAAATNVTIGDLGKKLTIKLTSLMGRG